MNWLLRAILASLRANAIRKNEVQNRVSPIDRISFITIKYAEESIFDRRKENRIIEGRGYSRTRRRASRSSRVKWRPDHETELANY